MTVKLSVPITITGKSNVEKAFNTATNSVKDFGKTVKQTNDLMKSAREGASDFSSKVTAISTSFLALERLGQRLADALSKPIEMALEAEAASTKLAASLRIANLYTEDNEQSVNDFATQLSKLAGIEDDAIRSITGTNIAMLKSVPNAEALTQASIVLAKSIGVDLPEANQMLVASLLGQDRALKKIAPELDAMSDKAMRAGGAVNYFADKYNSMITADVGSSGGAISRLKNQFGEIVESFGGAILDGFALPKEFPQLSKLLDGISDAVEWNRKQWEDLGHYLMTEFKQVLQDIPPLINDFSPALTGMTKDVVALTKLGIAPLIQALSGLGMAYMKLKDDQEGLDAFTRLGDRAAQYAQQGLDQLTGNRRPTGSGVFGNRGQINITPVSPHAPAVNERPGVVRPNDKVPERKFEDPKLPEDNNDAKKRMDDLLAMRKALAEQFVAVEANEGNQIIAEHASRMQKIHEMEQEASRKNLNISKEAGQLKTALAVQLERDLRRQQEEADRVFDAERLAMDDETQNEVEQNRRKSLARIAQMEHEYALKGVNVSASAARLKAAVEKKSQTDKLQLLAKEYLNILTITGKTRLAIELRNRMEVADLHKKLEAKLIGEQEYYDAVVEMNRKAREEMQQTTGDASTDETLDKIGGVIASAQGGINGIIAKVGSMLGPWGQFFAGIIQMLNQTKEQFNEFFTELLDQADQLPFNVANSIATLLERFPETLQRMFNQMFTTEFWGTILSSLWHGLLNMFHNFWAWLFHGTKLKQETEKEKNKQKTEDFKGFGKDDPNAGGGEFKIKDVDLQNKRRGLALSAKDELVEGITEGADEGGKTFWGYLKEGFSDLMDLLGKWFETLPDRIWATLKGWGEKIGDWGTKIWKGFTEAIGDVVAWFKEKGGLLWKGFKDAIGDAAAWFKEKGGMLWSGFKEAIGDIAAWFKEKGGMIWHGFKDAIGDIAAWFKEKGGMLWTGFKDAIGDAVAWFKARGGDIVAGVKALFTADYWKDLGGKVSEGFKSLFTADYWKGFGSKIWDGFKDAVKAVGSFFADLGKSLWDGAATALSNMWSGLKNTFGSIFKFDWDSVKQGMTQAFGSAFDTVKGVFAKIWNPVVDVINMLKIPEFAFDLPKVLGGKHVKIWPAFDPVPGDIPKLNRGGLVDAGMRNANVAALFAAANVRRYAEGGMVPGTGFRDTVPALLTPGERVLSRAQTQAMAKGGGGQTVNLNFYISGNAKVDKEAVREMMPHIIDTLRRESRNGTLVARQSGVY